MQAKLREALIRSVKVILHYNLIQQLIRKLENQRQMPSFH